MRAKRVGKFFKLNCRERSERKIFGKFCTFPQNSSKLRSDYLFSFQKRTNYLFPAFSRLEYLFPKSASPPSESNGRPLTVVGVDFAQVDYALQDGGQQNREFIKIASYDTLGILRTHSRLNPTPYQRVFTGCLTERDGGGG